MDERVMQFRVGVFVLASLLIAAILAILFGELPTMIRSGYTIHVEFPHAPGVTRDTPVRKSGILIGRVTEVELTDDGVLVTMRIDSHVQLRRTDICRIRGTLLGDAVVEFVAGAPLPETAAEEGGDFQGAANSGPTVERVAYGQEEEPQLYLIEGDRIRGIVVGDPLEMIVDLQVNLTEAIDAVGDTSREVGRVVTQVGDLLAANEPRIVRILEQTDRSLELINRLAQRADELVTDPELQGALREAIAQAPLVLSETRDLVDRMGGAVDSLERNLLNIEEVTAPLGQQGAALMQRIDTSAGQLEVLLDEMIFLTEAINDRQGTLGQLVHDRALYDHLLGATANIENLTRQLEPIVRDARVFSDKVARHPGSIVRDAVRPGPGIK